MTKHLAAGSALLMVTFVEAIAAMASETETEWSVENDWKEQMSPCFAQSTRHHKCLACAALSANQQPAGCGTMRALRAYTLSLKSVLALALPPFRPFTALAPSGACQLAPSCLSCHCAPRPATLGFGSAARRLVSRRIDLLASVIRHCCCK